MLLPLFFLLITLWENWTIDPSVNFVFLCFFAALRLAYCIHMPLSKQKSLSGLFITYSLMELLLCDSPRRGMTFFHLTSSPLRYSIARFSPQSVVWKLPLKISKSLSAKVILIPFVKTVEVKGRINLSRKKIACCTTICSLSSSFDSLLPKLIVQEVENVQTLISCFCSCPFSLQIH